MEVPINWKVVWALILTPAAGCLGYVLLIAFSLVTYHRLPIVGGTENWLRFFAIAFLFAATIGGVFAAPVTLAVLPIVRCRRPGRDKISFFALAFCGLVSGFLSPVVMTSIFAFGSGSVMKEKLEESVANFGEHGCRQWIDHDGRVVPSHPAADHSSPDRSDRWGTMLIQDRTLMRSVDLTCRAAANGPLRHLVRRSVMSAAGGIATVAEPTFDCLDV